MNIQLTYTDDSTLEVVLTPKNIYTKYVRLVNGEHRQIRTPEEIIVALIGEKTQTRRITLA